MSNFGSGLGYRLWHSEIVPIRRRGPEAHHELLTELAFWSIGCAPETVIPRIITANNCHSRGDPLPIRSERIARSYGKLRDGERLPRNSKRDAFAKALALHASGGGMPIPLFDPPPAIDPREERGTGISARYLAWWRNGAFDTGLTSAIGHISRAGHAESFFRAMRPAAAFH